MAICMPAATELRRGSTHPKAELNEHMVAQLRRLHDEYGWSVARCCRHTVGWLGRTWDHGNMHRILTRKSWRHVP
jgi:hypothetical protein